MSGSNSENSVRARLEAVDQLTDQDRLVEIACTDESPRVRLVAISKVDDDQRLLRVVNHAQELDVRLVAVERIGSQPLLADILKDRKNLQLVGMCLSRLTDRAVIESIAQDSNASPVARRMAVEHFADESYLAEASAATERKRDEDIDAFLRAYGGGLRGVRAIGRFKRSEKALRALGSIARRGGEAGGMAVEYLCNALGSSNPKLARIATEELVVLRDPDTVACLVRTLDDPRLNAPVRTVLGRIDTAEARAALGQG